MKNNIKTGKKGEGIAKQYLISKGYIILDLNFRSKLGEIDIIATSKDNLVFIEVKTRTNLNYGYPYEAVNRKKQQKIINTSLIYLKQKNILDMQLRYDIIEVYLTPNVRINHLENAFC